MSPVIDHRQAMDEFESMLIPVSFRSKISDQICPESTPTLRNPITLKGQKSQNREKNVARKKAPSSQKPRQEGVKEQALHDMIVKHPFLLHTPELFAGGLYLKSLLNKLPLPSHLITDFVYISVQGPIVKITLVEIEKSSKAVFHDKLLSQYRLRSEAEAAVNQVKGWKDTLRHDVMRKCLLCNLKPLFEGYPLPIFSPDGSVTPLAIIEISYMLVVGSEMPRTRAHQDLIDRLYLDESIILMTFPMMMELVRNRPEVKNVLKLGTKGIRMETLGDQNALHPIASVLSLAVGPTEDPYSVRSAGLGWTGSDTRYRDGAFHPASVKAIFYRSGGLCEKPGCSQPVVVGDKVAGGLSAIYNVIDEDSDVSTFGDTRHVALTCEKHHFRLNGDDRYTLGKVHPLGEAMMMRGPYRPKLDAQATTFSSAFKASVIKDILSLVEVDSTKEPGLAGHLSDWLCAVRSLYMHPQRLLASIVENQFMRQDFGWCIRDRALLDRDWRYSFLHGARLIRINHFAHVGYEIEANFFDEAFIDRLKRIFDDRASWALQALCQGDGNALHHHLKQSRKEREEREKQEEEIRNWRRRW
ncbi:protein of unknown function [Pseudomonas asturiensis]|uniref:Shedu protein SduA C-terminal domain-containing protein n=1 Tax=Pseudomonas asturiensis TaxID=1190415 RepID=A0A1M7PC63_9PSED|nr:Shedu anti-phage system protein SduA domain-containing protein [Pseudomonas asturiensis]SHN14453.1 protein of unknown function [Pseudomonas asturiensis]